MALIDGSPVIDDATVRYTNLLVNLSRVHIVALVYGSLVNDKTTVLSVSLMSSMYFGMRQTRESVDKL